MVVRCWQSQAQRARNTFTGLTVGTATIKQAWAPDTPCTQATYWLGDVSGRP